MVSFEQQVELLSKHHTFSHRNKTNINKRDAVLSEIQKHRENQSASIKFRRNLLESQKRSNYKNEYDRLKGVLSTGLVKEPSKQYINDRMGRLKELASQSVHGVNHDLYKPKTKEEQTDTDKLNGVNRKLKNHQKQTHIHNTMFVVPNDGPASFL